ncbi:hypothetical protein ONZ51_g5226 [Trametes cubensis]|uniref:Streptomycin biosynthesis protein StrI n=1 Tax=Trametes cubensis TaxID=1111947 RepID=A0AAD7TUL9_9APHY|nr:hypothetical protein ONZ51_g5226 [Trametes cubensis]
MPNDFAIFAAGPVTLAIVGCGQRGRGYAAYTLQEPTLCKLVAIAEPRLQTRQTMRETYSLDKNLVFETYEDLLKASADKLQTTGKRFADAVIITVQDHLHAEVALAFAAQGYHILCEKPMGTTVEACVKVEAAVKKAGVIFGIGHVLRYSPYTKAMTEVIRDGKLGPLINVVHIEPVGYWHFAHSYVRGNWARESESSFSLMTKSSHDIDLICHYLYPDGPTRVSSFGSLQHFRKANKPAEAGEAQRCLDCAYEPNCAYSAKKVYLDPLTQGKTGGKTHILVDVLPDIENITDALKTGPYGRRLVLDPDAYRQVVNLEFSNGATVSFTMVAHTKLVCERQTRLHFAYGEIVGDMNTFTVTDFRTGESTQHAPKNEGGHGGGDLGLFHAFVEAVRTGRQEVLGMDVTEVLRSHLTVFAAEKSRREGVVVDCVAFEKEAREQFGQPAGRKRLELYY